MAKKKSTSQSSSQATSGSAPGKDATSVGGFDEAVEKLEGIVERLETEDLPLEESLRLFEEGVLLARASQGKLDAAERKVEELLGVDERGEPLVSEIAVDTEAEV